MTGSTLPAPLSDADCDLRGYEFMPLFGHRLFASDFDAKATDLEFRIAMRLWWAAWQQCPAGSLPGDDAALCKLADLGRDMRTWRKVKATVLTNFVMCADGRLYHPLLCGEAKTAYEKRRKDRERKAAMRAGKQRNQKVTPGSSTDGPRTVRETSHGNGQDVRGTNATCPTDNDDVSHGNQQFVRVDRTGQDISTRRSDPVHPESRATAAPAEPPPEPPAQTAQVTQFMPAMHDHPSKWLGLVGKRGIDREGVTRPVVGGQFLDITCRLLCDAARINQVNWRGDWRPVIRWLEDGLQAEDIAACISRIAARPNYEPPRSSLAMFERVVRQDCKPLPLLPAYVPSPRPAVRQPQQRPLQQPARTAQ